MTVLPDESVALHKPGSCVACSEPGLVLIDDQDWCTTHAVHLLLQRMQRKDLLVDRSGS